jgi:hypothetical protein
MTKLEVMFYVSSIALGCSGGLMLLGQDSQHPDGRGDTAKDKPRDLNGDAGNRVGSNGISYHGGPLMTGGANQIYYIWYGNWSGNSATSILTTLAKNIGGSPYFNINTTYYNGSGTHITNAVGYGNSVSVGYTHGTSLTDSNIAQIVSSAITSGSLPANASGVYFVLTSADVHETSGFCTQYCGWHTYTTVNNTNIKYAFIGNGDQCPSACEAQTKSPNGNSGADGMASVISHELEESVTDPNLNAWYDNRGYENADKCAWTFGTTFPAANGSVANMTLGGDNFLIQQNWVNASGGYCALKY